MKQKLQPHIQFPVTAIQGISILIFSLILVSCNWQKSSDEDWVVRIDDHYLYRSELAEAIPAEMSLEDSAKMADSYINSWVKDHVVLVQAELNLPAEQMDFEKQLRNYRNSLTIYAFERELIKQKLDTVVSDAEIQRYYDENAQNFELKDFIVRVLFIKIPADAPDVSEIEQLMLSGTSEDIYALEDYSRQYAVFGFFDEERWMYFDELLRQIPVEITNKEEFLSQNKLVKLNEGDYLYILKIIDYQLKDGTSPLALVRKDIRNIIVNMRKREFIQQMRDDLLESANKNDEIEYNR